MKKEYPLSVVYILMVLAMFFWGVAFVWVRQAYDFGFRPITVVFLRLVVASVVLTVCAKLFRNREVICRDDYKWIFLLAFAEPFCYFMGESFGMLWVTPTLASIIVSTIPLVTPIFAWLFIREGVNIYEIVGIVVSFMGVVVLVVEDLNLGGRLLGIMLMFVAVMSGTAYSIILKKLSDRYNALTIVKYQTYIGMLLFMSFFYFIDYRWLFTAPIAFAGLGYIFLLGALPSSVSFTFLTIAVRRLGVVRTTVFSNLIPVVTAVVAYFVLKESFTMIKIVGMSVVIMGLVVSQMYKVRSGELRVKS